MVMGICVGGQSGCCAVCGAGRVSSQCMGEYKAQEPANTALAFACRIRHMRGSVQSWQEQPAQDECVHCTGARQHSMGFAVARPGGFAAVGRVGGSGSQSMREFMGTGARQHVMSICIGGSGGCAAVCKAGEDRLAALGRFHCKGALQHGIGICIGRLV